MPRQRFQEETPTETNLQNKPQRSSRGRLPGIALIVGALILIIAAAVVVTWQVNAYQQTSAPPSTQTTATTAAKGGNNNGVGNLPGANDPQAYWNTINQQIAQGLHLSVAQVQTRLQQLMNSSAPGPKGGSGDPASAVLQLATQQGLSGNQLYTLEISAIQQGCNTLVSAGSMTQAQATQRMQTIRGWDANELNGYVAYGFLQR